MAKKKKRVQDIEKLEKLEEIAGAIEKCWDDLQPHLSVCADCGATEHDVGPLLQVATLIQVAGQLVGYVEWTLTPTDGELKSQQSEHQTAQSTTEITTLDVVCDRLTDCYIQLNKYNTEFAECLEDLNPWYLKRAESLLEVAEDRLDLMLWRQSPEGQHAHAEHSSE